LRRFLPLWIRSLSYSKEKGPLWLVEYLGAVSHLQFVVLCLSLSRIPFTLPPFFAYADLLFSIRFLSFRRGISGADLPQPTSFLRHSPPFLSGLSICLLFLFATGGCCHPSFGEGHDGFWIERDQGCSEPDLERPLCLSFFSLS